MLKTIERKGRETIARKSCFACTVWLLWINCNDNQFVKIGSSLNNNNNNISKPYGIKAVNFQEMILNNPAIHTKKNYSYNKLRKNKCKKNHNDHRTYFPHNKPLFFFLHCEIVSVYKKLERALRFWLLYSDKSNETIHAIYAVKSKEKTNVKRMSFNLFNGNFALRLSVGC